MTSPGRPPSLPDAAEALLAGWPAPSKSALDWEDFASRTVQAARDAVAARTEDASGADPGDQLMAPPLPSEDGEGTLTAAGAPATEGEEPGLLSIAQKAVSANVGASFKEIALAGLQAADAERRDAPLAPAPRPPTRAEQEAQAVAGLMGKMAPRSTRPEPVRPVAAMRTAHVPVEASAHSEAPAPAAPRSRTPWAAVTASGVALSLAAAFAFYAGSRQAGAPEGASREPPVAAAPPAAASATGASPQVHQVPIASAAPLESLPRAGDDTLSFRVKRESVASKELVLEPKVAPAPVQARPEPAPKSKKARPLSDEMAAAVGESPAQKAAPAPAREPEISPGALPDRPSVGDAQAAAGPALMKARMCLAGQETGSQAKLTFGSDGKVKSVAISGPAAGTPAESCLRSQLSSARVPPFSEKSFSFSLTVRPP